MTAPSAPASRADLEARRSARRAALARMPKARLITMCRTGVTAPGGGRVVIEGGMYPLTAWSKDDLIASIMSAEFPPEVTQ
jgi:hypothetical protein